jgi:maltooligosyltrehalose trehalohydrolase
MNQVETNYSEEGKWITVRRGNVDVICNLGADHQAIPVASKSKDVLASEEGWQLRTGFIELPADSVAIMTS